MGRPIYLTVERSINESLEVVWETVALGFGNVAIYNPEIKSSSFDTELRSGVGTRRHCDFLKSGYIKEEIVEWNDLQSFRLKFVETSVPMSHLESKFSFSETNGRTIVKQEFWYRMKAPLGWLSRFMKRKMTTTLENGLDGLDDYLGGDQNGD